MAYRRSSSRGRRAPARGRSVSGYSRVRSRTGVRRSSGTSRRRSSAGGTRTVRLVIEQAAPSVAAVVGADGAYKVPDNTAPKRAKF